MCVCVQILRVVSQYLTTHDCPPIQIITIILLLLAPSDTCFCPVGRSVVQISDQVHTICHDELLIIRKKKQFMFWKWTDNGIKIYCNITYRVVCPVQ